MDEYNVVAIRRARLSQVITDHFDGKQAKFVEKTGINAGELSALMRNKPFGEKKARKLEKQLGLPSLWLDGRNGDDLYESVHDEFAWIYSHVSDEGRAFIMAALTAAKNAFIAKPISKRLRK